MTQYAYILDGKISLQQLPFRIASAYLANTGYAHMSWYVPFLSVLGCHHLSYLFSSLFSSQPTGKEIKTLTCSLSS